MFGGSRNSKKEGTVHLCISPLSTLGRVNSRVVNIAGLPWHLVATTECSKETNNKKFFSIIVCCNADCESTLWCCKARVQLRLVSRKENIRGAGLLQRVRRYVQQQQDNHRISAVTKWENVMNPESGYIKNDSVLVQALIKVKKSTAAAAYFARQSYV